MERKDILELYKSRMEKDCTLSDKVFMRTMNSLNDKYVDLVYNAIKNKNIVTYPKGRGKVVMGENSLLLHCNPNRSESFFHEVGHVIDITPGKTEYSSLTSTIILSNGKTLNEVVREETAIKGQHIFDKIKNIYTKLLNEELGEYTTELLLIGSTNKRKFRERYSQIFNVENYDYNNFRNRIYRSKAFEKIRNEEWATVLDAIETMYELRKPYAIQCHSRGYYKRDIRCTGEEFFANMFSDVAINLTKHLENTKQELPDSYNSFFELLDLLLSGNINNVKKVA